MKNRVVIYDAFRFTKIIRDNSLDLVITSPPYANQRKNCYGGVSDIEYPNWMKEYAKILYPKLKESGSFILNIKEHVSLGVRNPYVLKTLYKISKIFLWVDTFIWNKTNPFPTGSRKRLKDGFEYLFWFTKTSDYKFFPEQVLVQSTSKYLESEKRRKNKGIHYCNNGSGMNMSKRYISDMVRPSNVLTLAVDTTNHEHPAVFPIGIPSFFIKLLTKEKDSVFDPFMGSGTTCVAAKSLNRYYLGCDKVKRYVSIAKQRLEK